MVKATTRNSDSASFWEDAEKTSGDGRREVALLNMADCEHLQQLQICLYDTAFPAVAGS